MNNIDNLSAEELSRNNIKRATFRIKYPGYGAYDFENVVKIVIDKVFGWNTKTGEAHSEGGFFGKVLAFAGAIEEQGRKSLHGHWAIYLEGWQEVLKVLSSWESSSDEQDSVQKQIEAWFDCIGSTELIPDEFSSQMYYGGYHKKKRVTSSKYDRSG